MSTSPKNPWPYAIFGFYGLFACVVVTAAVLLIRRKADDLVAPDYYRQASEYQVRINATQAAKQPGHSFRVAPPANGVLVLERPPSVTNAITGTVKLYRPSDAALDQVRPMDLTMDGKINLPVAGLKSGAWRLQMEWKAGETAFYQEEDLFLP